MMKDLIINDSDRVLVLAPHPDDESIGCGGLLLKYSSQCAVLCLTDGRQGQGDIAPLRLAEIRKREFSNAMSYVNPNRYEIMDIEDGTLCAHLNALETVNLSEFNKIFVTGSEDRHPDHTAALTALKRACITQGITDPEIYVYEVHRPLKKITHLFSITDVIEEKRKLMNVYSSQMSNRPFDEVIVGINQNRGVGEGYSEGFYRINLCDIPDEIPLETEISKMREYYWIYSRWMQLLQSENSLARIIEKRGYRRVIIYGFKEVGKLLLEELRDVGIDVPFVLDKNSLNMNVERIECILPEAVPEDMKTIPIIVTATWYIDEIRSELYDKGFSTIISVKELLEHNG